MDRKLEIYCPGKAFPAVSVTGRRCALNCDHCRGYFLRNMLPVDGIAIREALPANVVGVMISGGCDTGGRLELSSRIEEIRDLSQQGLRVAVHSVLPTKKDCLMLADAGVEVICVDLHSDPAVIRSVMHLDLSEEDYALSLSALISSGIRVFPHITVGLSRSDWEGSLRLAADAGIKELAILGLMSAPATPMEGKEAEESEMLDAFRMALALGMRPTLGCMRPRSLRFLEPKLIDMGVRSIASPSRQALRHAAKRGLAICERRTCCCIRHTTPFGGSHSA